MPMTCGEATMRLLARYGITTVFGIPGVHTLDMCRGLTGGENSGEVRHIQARNEQGAGFMAEGWCRATGEVGVALVISGPGVTNAATALGQCYADSLPFLLISAEPQSQSIGKGWGVLHEITEQKKVTEPLTALSATVRRPSDVPELLAQAFTIFSSRRPRPVHISLPIDVQAEMVDEEWQTVMLPKPSYAAINELSRAAEMIKQAQMPAMIIGGGAAEAGTVLTEIAETIGAIVFSSSAGKGIVPDNHLQHLTGSLVRAEARQRLAQADLILAVGTELSETDNFVDRLEISDNLIRVDIDPHKINDNYPAMLGIIGDALPAMTELREQLAGFDGSIARKKAEKAVAAVKIEVNANLLPSEKQHRAMLKVLRQVAPVETIISGDACQQVYTGVFAFDVPGPRQWFYPAGFCALGNGLPNAIGAKLAKPDFPVVVLVGDGGFMFTVQELVTAAELQLSVPIILWENGGLKQIQDDMDIRDVEHVGVKGINPDFVALARSCHCHGVYVRSEEGFRKEVLEAFDRDRPSVIVVKENDSWLM